MILSLTDPEFVRKAELLSTACLYSHGLKAAPDMFHTGIYLAACGQSTLDLILDDIFQYSRSDSVTSAILVAIYRVYAHGGKVTLACYFMFVALRANGCSRL